MVLLGSTSQVKFSEAGLLYSTSTIQERAVEPKMRQAVPSAGERNGTSYFVRIKGTGCVMFLQSEKTIHNRAGSMLHCPHCAYIVSSGTEGRLRRACQTKHFTLHARTFEIRVCEADFKKSFFQTMKPSAISDLQNPGKCRLRIQGCHCQN